MYKNIGKKIQVLSIVLSILCAVCLLAFGVLCLVAALDEMADPTLQEAGIQATVLCVVGALLCPFLFWVLYGFGALVTAAQSNAEDSREIKEMLRNALSEGLLSDEIARKSAQAQGKSFQQLLSQMQLQPAQPQAQTHAPVQRLVVEPTPSEPIVRKADAPKPVAAAEAPVETPAATPAQAPTTEKTPNESAATTASAVPVFETAEQPVAKPLHVAPATPISNATPLRPIGGNDEAF